MKYDVEYIALVCVRSTVEAESYAGALVQARFERPSPIEVQARLPQDRSLYVEAVSPRPYVIATMGNEDDVERRLKDRMARPIAEARKLLSEESAPTRRPKRDRAERLHLQIGKELKEVEQHLAIKLNFPPTANHRQRLIELDRLGELVEDEFVAHWHELYAQWEAWAPNEDAEPEAPRG